MACLQPFVGVAVGELSHPAQTVSAACGGTNGSEASRKVGVCVLKISVRVHSRDGDGSKRSLGHGSWEMNV